MLEGKREKTGKRLQGTQAGVELSAAVNIKEEKYPNKHCS